MEIDERKLNVLEYLQFERDGRIPELLKQYNGDEDYVINHIWGPLETCLDGKTDLELIEIINEITTGTYDSLVAIKNKYSQHNFSVIIGQDNAETINTWEHHEKLIKEFSFVVFCTKVVYARWSTKTNKSKFKQRTVSSCLRGITNLTTTDLFKWNPDSGPLELNYHKGGDLYIQVSVETPQKLTPRQRELLKEFESESSRETHPESMGFFSKMKEFFTGSDEA